MKTMIVIHGNTTEEFNTCGIFIGDYCTHFADTFGTYHGWPEDDIVSEELREVIRTDMARVFPGSEVVFRDVAYDQFDETCKNYNEIAVPIGWVDSFLTMV